MEGEPTMRRRLITIAAMSMVAITLLTPALASAGQPTGLPENVILAESSRSAVTIARYANRCLTTEIFLSVSNQQQESNDGSNTDYRVVSLGVYQVHTCQDEVLLDIELNTDQLDFNVNDQLSGASVSGQTVATNATGEEIPVSLAVMWTPTSPRTTHQFSDEITVVNPATGEDLPVVQEETQIDRPAQARGTITVGDQTFQFANRDEDTFFVGFDLTWTMLAQ
jgi:hypothetical protein